ncbi:MAG TPA: class I SAM-dependent methyltransferase [Dongiaceae bacterium]|nr:class I SAM-dependent methyltransferase [Dongiaceae bacterium]
MNAGYDVLAQKEAEHWSRRIPDASNPQSWDDPVLHELFFGAEERRFLAEVAAGGSHALELGSGYGQHACELAARGVRVVGIDLSPVRVQAARHRAGPDGPSFRVDNFDTMRFPDGPFDTVYAHDALHHSVHLDHVIDEIHRVLRPGGRLVVSDFQGTVRALRVLGAAMAGVLPTFMPYARKWSLRHRVRAWVASESEKRAALERGYGGALHDGSPFEGISQESIVPAIARRLRIIERRSRLPFWWFLAPKLRLGPWRYPVARLMRVWDDALLASGVRGAFFTVVARRDPD